MGSREQQENRRIPRRWVGLALGVAVCALVAASTAEAAGEKAAPRTQLYFALELKREGKVVGTPKLLGEPGKWLHAERRPPGASAADYKLSLFPEAVGDGYRVELDLQLPQLRGHSEAISLAHGEERLLELGSRPGELQVNMLVMRVDSPEFEALMRLLRGEEATGPETI